MRFFLADPACLCFVGERHQDFPVERILAVPFLRLAAEGVVKSKIPGTVQIRPVPADKLRAAQGDWQGAFYYVIPVAAFFCGILLTETIKLRTSDRHFLLWQHFSLLVEMALLAVVGFLPLSVPDAVVNVTISFVCSVQVQSFRKTRGLLYATTMCTGNLRSAADCFSVFLFQKDPLALRSCLRYLLIIFCFCAGAAAGAGCSQWLGAGAVWLCCGALGLVFAVMALGKKALAQM